MTGIAITRAVAALSVHAALTAGAGADTFDLAINLEYTQAFQFFNFNPGMDQSFTFDPPEMNTISGRYEAETPFFDDFNGDGEYHSLRSTSTAPVMFTEGPGLIGDLGALSSTSSTDFVRMQTSSLDLGGGQVSRSARFRGFYRIQVSNEELVDYTFDLRAQDLSQSEFDAFAGAISGGDTRSFIDLFLAQNIDQAFNEAELSFYPGGDPLDPGAFFYDAPATVTDIRFDIVPAPASFATLGLAALWGRRRR